MNITAIVISILITVICVLLALLQHYYINYINYYKKTTDVKLYVPIFEDMISTEDRNNYALDFSDRWQPDESEILNSLDEALKSRIAATTESPTIPLRNDNFRATESEVHNSLQAALAFKLSGKIDKAMKLFEHAAAIAPENPDVLNRYGEFIEHMHNDIVAADELYFKALTHSPDHKAALMNRKRTAHIVDKLDLKVFKSIDEKRDILQKIQQTNPIYDTVRKQAYYLHIYHTVGIEGNTMSLEQMRYVLETGQAVQGKSILEHNEILGLELAMQYIKILTRFPTIDVKEILGIHRRVLGHVDPLNSGTFRDKQVFVGSHVPPPPEDLPGLMQSYVEWLNSEEAQSMHPVRYAALAHYKLVDIHPFSDGNGRTSRLIMNLILLRAGYPPVMILKHHREKYYEYLNLANKGDVRPFVRFIAQCTEHMLDVYLWSTERFSHSITSLDPVTIGVEEDNRNI
ncbi:hypothetical protein ILUMI_23863 [Ignelater luminosus]|uniref:Protein adenylyltransferase Fic n=1 Tax=Ignelater luminosus TaxID=2038154 RepID=A0A8K0G1G4_IGNLU|nr:hypothetical protein ILUMI_23863 [Ignelater luminosus]